MELCYSTIYRESTAFHLWALFYATSIEKRLLSSARQPLEGFQLKKKKEEVTCSPQSSNILFSAISLKAFPSDL